MEIKHTPIEGLLEIVPKVYGDSRGWFLELFKEPALSEFVDLPQFPQDNLSYSQKGVVRGLHLQLPPCQQAKLVSVIQGKVLDIVVDLRKNSKTFGESYSTVLDSESHKLLFVPEGFAHGFSAQEDSLFHYKCSSVYNPNYETGIRWDDPELNLDWRVADPILSDKDRQLPLLKDLLAKSVISHE